MVMPVRGAKSLNYDNLSWVSMEILRLTITRLERDGSFAAGQPIETVCVQPIKIDFPWLAYREAVNAIPRTESGLDYEAENRLREDYWIPAVSEALRQVKSARVNDSHPPFNAIAVILRDSFETLSPAITLMLSPPSVYEKVEDARKRWVDASREWTDSVGLAVVICATDDAISTMSGLIYRQKDAAGSTPAG